MINKGNNKGLFIVCEGLDGAGKTTTIKGFIRKSKLTKDYFYSKGLKSDTFIGRFAGKYPSTLTFFLELAYITNMIIKPKLKGSKIVLQDRYNISLLSFIPAAEKWYSRLASFMIKPYIIKPDLLVYFAVEKEIRIERLKRSMDNKYHATLVNHPGLIDLREKKYLELYMNHDGKKALIETSNKSIDTVAREFGQIISNFRQKNLCEQKATEEHLKKLQGIRSGAITSKELANALVKKRAGWLKERLEDLLIKYEGLPPEEQAFHIIYDDYMRINPADVKMARVAPGKIRIESYNFCPYLQACSQLGLDTRVVCKEIGEPSFQEMAKIIHPNLIFSRDYEHIRPYNGSFCEEFIELANQNKDALQKDMTKNDSF